MRLDSLERHFESIGARVKFGEVELPRWLRVEPASLWEERQREVSLRRLPSFTIGVSSDRKGEYFDIRLGGNPPGFEILQSVPRQRHLLMMTDKRTRFLCGHDERHWFAAEIWMPVSTVREARYALLPSVMRDEASAFSDAIIGSRKNGAFIRQGEWFFVPVDREFEESVIRRNHPIRRDSGGKAHICEELVRERGETVYLVRGRVKTQREYSLLSPHEKRTARAASRNSRSYARGYVRHPDHSTITLDRWHLVLLSSENRSSNLAFLD